MSLAFVNFPIWLKPEIIPGFFVRWYGVMYIVAFALAYIMMRKQIKSEKLDISDDDIMNFFFWAILALIIGARVFSALIYDTSGEYWRKPWLIFWPFKNGQFVGLQGMSYHGGVIGAAIGTVAYCVKYKKNWFQWADLLALGIPLGYTFGRLGNFINGELWGRVTTAPWGMIFPGAPRLSTSTPWVKEMAMDLGIAVTRGVNLPRHPSQLYEAFFEGLFLWAILWFVLRNRKKFHGAIISSYLMGYGFVRFIIEYFREPDAGIGFPIEFVETNGEIHRLVSVFNFSTGQILCFIMMLGGSLMYGILARRAKDAPLISSEPEKTLPPSAKKKKKKKRK